MVKKHADVLQGTLDMLILKTLAPGPQHGWGISQRIQQVSDEVLQVNQGSLYPALHRPRATGVAERLMGPLRQQPPGEVLRLDPRRTPAARA